MRACRAFAAKLIVSILVCLLAACSAVRLGYSHGETVAYWWLDSYVDFTSEQKPWVKAHIDRLFAWHRATQLTDYAQLLLQVQGQLQHEVSPAVVSADADALKKRMLTAIDHAMPELADLALSLQPQQIAHIEKKFAANNDKYRKEFLSGDAEKRQLARYKQVMTHAEYWFGNFSHEQEVKIRAASDARTFDGDMMMVIRLRRQRELIAVLRQIQAEKPDHATTMRMLRDYVAASLTHFGDAKAQAVSDAYADETMSLAQIIVNMTTPKQKAFAMSRIKQWVEDCRQMAHA
jgi:hypothetical protein